ncbi:exonuclease SbcCD subunit D [Alicyclobacillus sp. SO9]|uniref:exonuclease SbcCD subunit D n=1 Tax=Alicyclobacillus sp. SO9 TaxID=2665646 RepID=UPI0018E7621C|nr:exonuclease SbcCD subunit D [Alicyclobacillus sp. SO9]QQE80573.1 exonuclease subunit SbcD [Alicyclobacillus sp. SO9]
MRILHTADWHFGKTLEGRNRIAEQAEFVDELITLCEKEAVDLVLMAGDVYQTVNPSAEAEALFYRALDGLSAGGARGVVVIAGNHDNAQRINAAGPLADKAGITLLGLPKDSVALTSQTATERGVSELEQRVERVDGGVGFVELKIPGCKESAVVAAVPYPSEGRLNEVLSETLDEEQMQQSYNKRIGELFQELAGHFRDDTVNLLMSHLYVNGGIESESEVQIQIGGAYAVSPDVFPQAAHYVALGHLHRPQDVKGAKVPVRYSGSPLAYSFSEEGQKKSVTLIDALPGQPVSIREVSLQSGKPLVEWNATEGIAQVEQWVADGRDGNAWIDLKVHVQTGLDLENIHYLRDLHPGFVHIHPILPVADGDTETSSEENRDRPSVDEMFRRFFEERTGGAQADDELVELFLSLVAEEEADAASNADDGQGDDGDTRQGHSDKTDDSHKTEDSKEVGA